jgi:major membrane immunogen (membrane-anchored lipoprotein)
MTLQARAHWAKMLLAHLVAAAILVGCSTSNSFDVDPNDNCYRTRELSFLGWTYKTERVLAFGTNCGETDE